jgi:hypothetical protein
LKKIKSSLQEALKNIAKIDNRDQVKIPSNLLELENHLEKMKVAVTACFQRTSSSARKTTSGIGAIDCEESDRVGSNAGSLAGDINTITHSVGDDERSASSSKIEEWLNRSNKTNKFSRTARKAKEEVDQVIYKKGFIQGKVKASKSQILAEMTRLNGLVKLESQKGIMLADLDIIKDATLKKKLLSYARVLNDSDKKERNKQLQLLIDDLSVRGLKIGDIALRDKMSAEEAIWVTGQVRRAYEATKVIGDGNSKGEGANIEKLLKSIEATNFEDKHLRDGKVPPFIQVEYLAAIKRQVNQLKNLKK